MTSIRPLAPGVVDDRSVSEVKGRELEQYNRVHLFAGIGGFEIACQLAKWPDDRVLWTGGFPCQPFSTAGRQGGTGDNRYLWPEFYQLIDACRPEFVLIENVPGIDGKTHMVLDRVPIDLESSGYEVWLAEIPACAVDAAHLRNRVWIVANNRSGLERRSGERGDDGSELAAFERGLGGAVGNGKDIGRTARRSGFESEKWFESEPCGPSGGISGHDNKFRRLPLGLLDPSVVLADGLPSRRVALHSLGNAIAPLKSRRKS